MYFLKSPVLRKSRALNEGSATLTWREFFMLPSTEGKRYKSIIDCIFCSGKHVNLSIATSKGSYSWGGVPAREKTAIRNKYIDGAIFNAYHISVGLDSSTLCFSKGAASFRVGFDKEIKIDKSSYRLTDYYYKHNVSYVARGNNIDNYDIRFTIEGRGQFLEGSEEIFGLTFRLG